MSTMNHGSSPKPTVIASFPSHAAEFYLFAANAQVMTKETRWNELKFDDYDLLGICAVLQDKFGVNLLDISAPLTIYRKG
jgi:hypothetical protein